MSLAGVSVSGALLGPGDGLSEQCVCSSCLGNPPLPPAQAELGKENVPGQEVPVSPCAGEVLELQDWGC